MNGTQSFSISQLRQNTASLIDSVVSKLEPAVILQRSKPKAVLVDYDYFNALEEAALDLTDSLEAEKAKAENSRSFASYLVKRWGSETL